MAEDTREKRPASSDLEGEAQERLKEARQWKESTRILDFKECYFFLAPWRNRQISSLSIPPRAPMLDQPELYTDLGFLVTSDFITEIINTYLPEAQIWCERKAGMDTPDEIYQQVADQVRAQDKKIFEAIKSSNFYAEIPKACNPDLVIAGAALWIHRRVAHEPIECLAVPMREMEINLGPNGEIDDRFVVKYEYNKYVKARLGDDVWSNLSKNQRDKIESKPSDRTQIVWGFWRKWDKIDDETWQHVILLADELIHDCELKGEGCCPFIVFRFNPTADWPWAHGPAQQGLPTFRQTDVLERQKLEAVEGATNPAITYPDDSFTEVEQGIEPGMAYPIRPGSENAVKAIYNQPTIQPEIFEIELQEKRLRKLFFVDYPEQSGDTPPTLGQWLDEMARAQRRIGTPGFSFWREGPRAFFLRFKFLLEQSGTLKKIVDQHGRFISTQAYNPAQRAAEQQEIAIATQCANLLAQMFPEEWRVRIDGGATMQAFIAKMRTSGLIKMRNKQDIASAIQQMQQFVQARREPGAPQPPPAAGAPAPQ